MAVRIEKKEFEKAAGELLKCSYHGVVVRPNAIQSFYQRLKDAVCVLKGIGVAVILIDIKEKYKEDGKKES